SGTTSQGGFFGTPGLNPGFPVGGDGPGPPYTLTRIGLEGGDKPANAPVSTRNARDDHILHDQRSHSRAVVLGFIRHHLFPNRSSSYAVQGKQVGIVGRNEDLVSKNRCAAICPERVVTNQ